jgi:hypothetical protein
VTASPSRPAAQSNGHALNLKAGPAPSMLRRTGLIEEDGRLVRAAETLFLGALA